MLDIGWCPNEGVRSFLVQTPEGNVWWDCITLHDEPTQQRIDKLGGLAAIAICHPHYYSGMIDWARANDCPIHLHEADRQYVAYADDHIHFFTEDQVDLPGGLTLLRTGGHFAGSTALHWPTGAEGRGVMLTGDSLKTTADLAHVSFVRSSPNDLPLAADDADHIVNCLELF